MTSVDRARYAIEQWGSVFTDPEIETRFRGDNIDINVGLIRACAVIVAIASVAFLVFDAWLFGVRLDANTAIRAALFVVAMGVLVHFNRPRAIETVDRAMFLFAIVLIFGVTAIQVLRPSALPLTIPVMVLITIGIYLFFPGDVRRVALLGALTCVVMTAGEIYRPDTTRDQGIIAIVASVITNALGLIASRRGRVLNRRQFAARLALEDALERIGRSERAHAMFVAMLSHDLRNYLNGIVGTSQVMLGADDDASWRKQARTISETSRNLVRLLDDALDMLRARQSELKVEPSDFDLGRTIAGVCSPLRNRAEAKGLRLDVRVSPMIPESLYGDEFRITQILSNLISNCIQFTARGEVGLEVLPVGDEEPPTRIRFVVTDTGVPLTDLQKETLFNPDVRLDGSNQNARSAGLGLYIFKVLIERLGGTVSVSSAAERGNRFVVELDFKPAPHSTEEPRTSEVFDQAATRALAVMAVDDSPVNLEIIEISLRRLGHIVVSARDGETALRLARAQAFDIALVDLRMPGMSGEELVQALHKDPAVRARGPVPLIVAVTAEAFVDLSSGRVPAGFDGLLPKPINLIDLSRYLGIARARAAELGADIDNTQTAMAIDWERLSELKNDLDRGGLERVMATGRSFVEQSLARLDKAVGENAIEDALAIAHALKGAAANMGLAAISRGALEIEQALRRNDVTSVGERVGALRRELPSTLTAVDAWMGRPARPGTP